MYHLVEMLMLGKAMPLWRQGLYGKPLCLPLNFAEPKTPQFCEPKTALKNEVY